MAFTAKELARFAMGDTWAVYEDDFLIAHFYSTRNARELAKINAEAFVAVKEGAQE